MEFYEFFEKLIDFFPEGYESAKAMCQACLPWLYAIFTIATCFFGHFMHKVWNACLFFSIGFFLPLIILFAVLKEPSGVLFWILVLACLAIGVLCAVYSKHLFKTKLFITTFVMVYITVSDYLITIGKGIGILVGLLLALIAGILSIKYKYMMLMITTSFSGSFLFWNWMEDQLSFSHLLMTAFAVLMGCLGLAVQIFVEKEELKESYHGIRKHSEKVKKLHKKIRKEEMY